VQKTLSASATPASECQNPQSLSQPQSHASVPIDVTFLWHLPKLPRKQISPEVLASQGYTPEVPSQYICDQMEPLGPMYVFDLFHYTIYPLVTHSSLNVSGFAVYKGSCLRVHTAQDTCHQSRWPNFNINASYTYGSNLLFCPIWSGAAACHDVPHPLINPFPFIAPTCPCWKHLDFHQQTLNLHSRFPSCHSHYRIQNHSPS
jgi:hypothetical protein